MGRYADAEAGYRLGAAIAREQNAPLIAYSIRMCLVELFAEQGRSEDGERELAEAVAEHGGDLPEGSAAAFAHRLAEARLARLRGHPEEAVAVFTTMLEDETPSAGTVTALLGRAEALLTRESSNGPRPTGAPLSRWRNACRAESRRRFAPVWHGWRWRACSQGAARQFAFAPDALTSSAQRGASLRISSLKSATPIGRISSPTFESSARNSGVASSRLISALRRATMADGVPAGAAIDCHACRSSSPQQHGVLRPAHAQLVLGNPGPVVQGIAGSPCSRRPSGRAA